MAPVAVLSDDGWTGEHVFVCVQQERRDNSDRSRPHPLRWSPLGYAWLLSLYMSM